MENIELEEIILNEIVSKKQFSNLDKEFLNNRIKSYFLTNGDKLKKLKKEFKEKNTLKELQKNKNLIKITKEIKAEIGNLYGCFQTKNFPKKNNLLNEIKEQEEIEQLLQLHKSSKERAKYYKEIYSNIFTWYMPKHILDLACGLNPLSYIYFSNKNIKYTCYDLDIEDSDFLNNFFKKFNINGKAYFSDITNLKFLENNEIKTADLVFLFKALDSFERIKKNISKEIILKLPVSKIVVSFSTKSLISKKSFKKEKRNWFYNFLNKNNFHYTEFEIENEIFLLINKNKKD